MIHPIPYGRQSISEEDIASVISTLKSDFLTQGPKIAEFEKKFAEYVGAKYAIAVSNGTAALHLSVLALGLKPGQKVITTPITFAASANCILYADGEVAFADIDPDSGVIDLLQVKKLLESNPPDTFAGVIPVDFSGYPVNLELLRQLADEHGLWILEDACHAPGGYFKDSNNNIVKCGSATFSDVSVFSFHPVKHIATGEGGMITTNNLELYEKLKILRTHGITREQNLFQLNTNEIEQGGWYYEMQELGYNYRMPDILAALGVSQLSRAKEGIERRREIARMYFNAFENSNVTIMSKWKFESGHAYHLFVVKSNSRRNLYEKLKQNQIFAQVHYIPVHLMPFYQKKGFHSGMFPNAEKYYEEALSLPMFPSLTNEEVERVIGVVLEAVKT